MEDFPEHNTLKFLREVQTMMATELNVLPKEFKDRIIFISIYSDIGWSRKGNEDMCVQTP